MVHFTGWLFRTQGLLLVVPLWRTTAGSTEEEQSGDTWYAGESKTVTVLGLKADGQGKESNCNSEDLSLLLRLQGPEALAEVSFDVVGKIRTLHVKPRRGKLLPGSCVIAIC